MRSRLIKKGLLGLPRTHQRPAHRPRSRLHRSGYSPAVQAFFAILFGSLGLSFAVYWVFHRLLYSRSPITQNSVLSRFTSKPPLVDHTILEKIAGIDLEDGTDSGTDFSIPINVNAFHAFSPFYRPPRVTSIPEVQPQAPPDPGMETQDRFCSEWSTDHIPTRCKFLLPLRIVEQGLNAHAHLVQLLEFARALNRTLVLPNVGKNGVGACRRWRFGVYYDEQVLSSKFGGGSGGVIQQNKFRAWADSLASPPSSQLVSLDWTYHKGSSPVAVSGQNYDGFDFFTRDNPDTVTMLYNQTGCLNRKFPQLDLTGPFPPLSLVIDHGNRERSDGDISRTLLEKLSESTLTHAQSESLANVGDGSMTSDFDRARVSPDVLIVSWNIHSPIFQPHSTTALRYSPQLRSLATRLVRRLGPYIAVAWDVETSESDVVLGCVEALRSALHYVLHSHEEVGIRNIWLAGNLSPSDLLNSPEPLCPSALTEEPFFAPNIRLTGVQRELERMVREGEEVDDVANNGGEVVRKQEVLRDAGVLGILDRLVSMRSTVFVTASKTCGKPRCVFPFPVLEHHRNFPTRPKNSVYSRERSWVGGE